ncbi:hypothetical protein CDAR_482651 [Caerostris darwini]|uniref:Uncharacterized protein n=1 Tax=Caerostris darwini TaxID=1538125 RepID=A0AAV4RIN2_9ARAC|nr:hypothetical protein CDAR_482651 [Caerostris darwini]
MEGSTTQQRRCTDIESADDRSETDAGRVLQKRRGCEKRKVLQFYGEICFFFHHFNFDRERVAKLLRQKSRLGTAWFFVSVMPFRASDILRYCFFPFTPWTTQSYVGMTYDSKRLDYKPVNLVDTFMI